MEELIQTINQLQDVFSVIGSDNLQLPQIIVVGAQSSGKSSVLENLVGRSFLPRGPGVVTRCPIILQLLHFKHEDFPGRKSEYALGLDEWGVFLHKKDVIYNDFVKIREEIELETDRKAGKNKGMCAEPIVLKIFSTGVLSLTLVDLPGLTKNPVGEQPPDIEFQIREMVINYISNPNSIILAVVTANTDMATSESLKIAREVDPDGARTLAVVTKLDIMDDGTDALDILCGRVIPVKLGIVGVVNRSQKDTLEEKTIKQALKDEAVFLRSKYRSIAQKNGTVYLSEKLQNILMNRIRDCLPNLKTRINTLLVEFNRELESYGDFINDKGAMLLQIITQVTNYYCSTIKGNSPDIDTTELCGGARINYIFNESFGKALNSIHPLTGFSKNAILTAIKNASGASPAIFIPEISFELLVKRQIKRLRDPCLRCVELVHNEMLRIVQHCFVDPQLRLVRFPKLQQSISEVVTQLLHNRIPITIQMIENLISIELAYIHTSHPEFIKEKAKICNWLKPNQLVSDSSIEDRHSLFLRVPKRKSPKCTTTCSLSAEHLPIVKATSDTSKQSSIGGSDGFDRFNYSSIVLYEREQRDVMVIEELIKSYFRVVRQTIEDSIPKTIMHFLVNYVMEHLQSELVTNLYKAESFDELLDESKVVTQKRKDASEMVKSLKKANIILGNIRESHLW